MNTAQLTFADVVVGGPVRPLVVYLDQMQLVEWGEVSGNADSGHWHIFSNRWKETADPEVSELGGNDPSVTGQFKMAMMERMLVDWAGPRTWVKAMDVKYRVWDHFFEMKTFTGRVTGKRQVDGLNLVDVELEMCREDGRPTTLATATVALP